MAGLEEERSLGSPDKFADLLSAVDEEYRRQVAEVERAEDGNSFL